jgi:hypothetical protein
VTASATEDEAEAKETKIDEVANGADVVVTTPTSQMCLPTQLLKM